MISKISSLGQIGRNSLRKRREVNLGEKVLSYFNHALCVAGGTSMWSNPHEICSQGREDWRLGVFINVVIFEAVEVDEVT